MDSPSPKWLRSLVSFWCDEYWVDEVLGDLEEQFHDNLNAKGLFRSRMIYFFEVIRFIRPHLFRKRSKLNYTMMTFSHIKISYRNLIRNKVYAAINLFGLSIGLASVILIGIYIQFETSYDQFFEDSDRIHRVALHRVYPGRTKDFGTSSIRMAPVLNENYPEVEVATRLHRLFFQNEITVTFEENEKSFVEDRFLFADSLYFDVFSYDFIQGNAETALDAAEDLVVTRSIAMKYYGRVDVVGETVNANGGPLTISGVIEDIPANAHVHFDLLGAISSLQFLQNAESSDNWTSPWVYTYVKLDNGVDPSLFEAKLEGLVDRFADANLSSSIGAEWKELGHSFDYFLQPLTDIHLHSQLDVEVEPNSDFAYVQVLLVIAIIILLISGINFVNLSIARSTERAREVGVRKVLGSYRSNLVFQFLTESLLVCTIAAVISLVLVYLFVPRFNDLLGTALNMTILQDVRALMALVGFVLLVGVGAGLYPALSISTLGASTVLKGSYKTSQRGVWLRNTLIVFQFLISIIMISGSIVADSQMKFLQDKDLGFEDENVLVIKQSFNLGEGYNAFKNDLLSLPGVKAVGGANMIPGEFHGSNVFRVSDPDVADIRVNTSFVDDDHFDAIGFNVLEGRGFDPAFNDSLSIVINESAVMAMSISPEQAIGMKYLSTTANNPEAPTPQFTIVGVVEDYHFYSLHSQIGPMVIFNGNTQFIPTSTVVKVEGGDLSGILKRAEESWIQLAEQPFNYSFLKEDLKELYSGDQNTIRIFDIFTFIAIAMSCVGLFGLATYVVNQRSKEMSIRKVLGASLGHVILSFSKEFMYLIAFAFVVGVPMAYFMLDEWLSNFAYHASVELTYFIAAGVITLCLVMITVSYQAIKIALVNPVKTLRSE